MYNKVITLDVGRGFLIGTRNKDSGLTYKTFILRDVRCCGAVSEAEWSDPRYEVQ